MPQRFHDGGAFKVSARPYFGERQPVKIAQEQLGHASISTTLNIYTHVVDASHRKAVEDVEERLFGDLARNGPKLAVGLENATPASRSVN